jgi:hypothetical protein
MTDAHQKGLTMLSAPSPSLFFGLQGTRNSAFAISLHSFLVTNVVYDRGWSDWTDTALSRGCQITARTSVGSGIEDDSKRNGTLSVNLVCQDTQDVDRERGHQFRLLTFDFLETIQLEQVSPACPNTFLDG